MNNALSTFLMFEGQAQAALDLYLSLFEDASVHAIERYPDGSEHAGRIKLASFQLRGHQLRCSDSPIHHAFTFTPSISLFVECRSGDEQERLFARLSEDGKVYMPLDNYGFSARFGWVGDRFGVSWQLNLA